MAPPRVSFLSIVSAFLILMLKGQVAVGDCPGGWQVAGGSCYLLQPTAVEHSAALALCGLYQANLVSISSQDEYNVLLTLIEAAGGSGYWIGLTRGMSAGRAGSSSYNWTDGTPYSAAQTHWLNGFEGYGFMGLPTSCATMDGTSGLVSFQPCVFQFRPFCERSATLPFVDACNIDDGWQDIDGACYKLFDVPSSWNDARQECLRQSADLYIPNTSPYVIDGVMSCRVSVTHVWLGVSDTAKAGVLLTVNNSVPIVPWTNNDSTVLDPGNTCVEVMTSPIGSLSYNNDLCTVEKEYICQKPHGTCAAGWDQHGSRCYRWQTSPSAATTWYLAKKACADQGAELLVLHDMEQHQYVALMLNQNKVPYSWLGFSDESTPDVLQWVDGTLANGTGVFDVWAPNYPYPLPGKVDCGIFEIGPQNSAWSHGYCYNTRAYVCDIALGKPLTTPTPGPTFGCDVGWQLLGTQCYYFGSERDTWNGSSLTCQTQQARLAIIKDTMVQSYLRLSLPDASVAWIGLKLDRRDMHYYWVDASPVSFSNYAPGEPDGRDSGMDCIAITSGSGNYPGGWVDQNCNTTLDYVCQKDAAQTGGPTQSTAVTLPWTYRCGLGWLLNSQVGACYLVQVGAPKTWQAAMLDCRRRGGDLLSVSGPSEQLFIETTLRMGYTQYQDPFWIGASDSTLEGGWEWSDGSPFRYLNWHPGEPNNVGVGEDCAQAVVAWGYMWNDKNCDNTYNYICKKTAAPATNSHTPAIPTLVPPSKCVGQAVISGLYSLQSQFSFSSSSDLDANHTAANSRLLDSNPFSWRPQQDQTGEYLEVHFYQTMLLTSVNVGGEPKSFNYVTKYKIQYQYNVYTPWYWVEQVADVSMVFDGPTDDGESSVGIFPKGIHAQRVRLYPQEWASHIAVQWELNGCVADQCQADYAVSGPLVVMDGYLTGSSMSDPQHTPHSARLQPIQPDTPPSCWRPGAAFDPSNPPWIQADLGTIKLLSGITIMGNPDADEYVTLFQLQVQLNDASRSFVVYQEPYGTPMNFTGNVDNNSTVTYLLKSTIPAQQVRIVPLAYHNYVALRFDLLVCSLATCRDIPLLSGKHNVSDAAFTASSSLDPEHGPFQARIGQRFYGADAGAWVAKFNDAHQYIQVDLGELARIWAVATQGDGVQQWVAAYTLAFSQDGNTFTAYSSNGHDAWEFDGNFDASSIRKHFITMPTVARYVQLWPTDYRNAIALRLEIYGCPGPEAGQLVGCFIDDPSNNDLPEEPLVDPLSGMGPVSCRYHCFEKGYAYAGLQRGIACSCGDSYGKYGESAASCTMSCLPPYQQSACGGHNANSVYTTGLAPLHKYCTPGWISSGDWCYTVNIDLQTWFNARTNCRQYGAGADLATINGVVENDLVFSALAASDAHTTSAWIGMNDLQEAYFYEWSSGSDVVYTNWDVNQPVSSPTQEQHCVAMNNQTGGWQTMFCERTLYYVCKMPKQPSPIPRLPPIVPGCEPGYSAFLPSCYQLILEPQSWQDAARACQTSSATLVRITDRFEQAYVASLLGSAGGFYWTDSSDIIQPTVYQFTDMTSSRFYTNWGPRQPGSPRQCVALATGPSAGLWYTFNCNSLQHVICEKQRVGFTAAPLPPLVPPGAHCPQGWFEGDYSCYQTSKVATQLSWDEARADCQSIGAELASFHSHKDFDAVWRNIMAGSRGNFWIGLHYSMQSSALKWSDETGVNFVQWEAGQSAALEGLLNCVEVNVETGNMLHQNCFSLRNWVCAIMRGQLPKLRTTVVYPTAGTPGSCLPFDDNWRYFGGSCYYVSQVSADDAWTWREARAWCRSMSVDLVSITSVQEQLFVQSLILNVSAVGLWIGLNELDIGHGMRWSDGSPTTYENWDVNEPNHFGNLEWCVDILIRNGKWNDEVCTRKMGFICEQTIGSSLPPTTPSVAPTGYCPTGFSMFGTKCLRIFGSGMGESLLPWSRAWDFCSSAFGPGFTLASIGSAEENLFVTTLMGGRETGVWFGLRRFDDGTFAWTDNSETTFTNWDVGEPSGGVSSCVYIRGSQRYAGLWNDAPCGQQANYICQSQIDPHISTPEAIPNPCNGKMGFEPFKVGCYKYVSQALNFSAARDQCHTWAADLPVVDNAYTQAFLQLLVARNAGVHADSDSAPTVWIGLSDITSSGVYTWTVGWPVTYSNWASEEPSRGPGEGCVSMGSNGMWSDRNCTQQLPFVCVILNASFTIYTPQPPRGQCIGLDWVPQGDFCYLLKGDDRQTFYEAQLRCSDRGAQLASVHDNETLQFLTSMILPQTPYLVWLGLYGSQTAGFGWLDSTPVEFVNWAAGQPSGVNQNHIEEHCVAMSPNSKTWDDLDCSLTLGYICSKPQEIDPNQKTQPPVEVPELTPVTRYEVPQKTPIIPSKRTTAVPPTPSIRPPATIPPPTVFTQTPAASTRRQQQQQTSGTSSVAPSTQPVSGVDTAHNATVAGSVIGVVLFLVILAAILLYVREKQQVGIFARPYHETTFSNILYNLSRARDRNSIPMSMISTSASESASVSETLQQGTLNLDQIKEEDETEDDKGDENKMEMKDEEEQAVGGTETDA